MASPPDAVSASPYPNVVQQANFPLLEQGILDFWRQDGTFLASIDQRPAGDAGENTFVFYDGPPFANGLPHYGHLVTGFVKDAVPRYQTMRGRRVERRFGWDCHGLPAEMETEKELGISGHLEIEKYGIQRFNRACELSVLQYTEAWERYVTRQARWVDFENDYKTLDLSYMESVMWVFKQLWDKGLIYEGYRVLPFCWECETPLSNFETRLDDAYRERQDRTVTVLFELETGERMLVWTTTPWTLPSNLALAVGEDIEYAVYSEAGKHYIVGEATAAKYERELASAERVGTRAGRELVGLSYRPLFPYFAEHANAFRVLAADFVSTEEGTGIVHLAPGFGEDDQLICEQHGIAVVCPVDERGRFTSPVADYENTQVFDANAAIIRDLKARGAVVRDETYSHAYPHCWRTDTPLIYRAVTSWFVEVTRIKQRALELNQQINWVPGHVREGAFGSWLENARDWSISRNRFWGSPIPVWKSDDPNFPRIDVYGSLEELERDFGVRPENLHRPNVDDLTRPNPDDPTGRSTMRRVSEVLDCWFESGSMPYAQVHYPFENREWFENHFPADFIVEYIGQTRAWFYNLHVLSTALFDSIPFRNCVVHGVVLGDDGRKASKSLRNYPDPFDVFETYGADAMRWALLSSPVLRGGDLVVSRQNMADAVRSVLNPIWNAWYFFSLYANTDSYEARFRVDAEGALDRYILAKTAGLIEDVTGRLDAYEIAAACGAVESFLEALNNWYIRRSRDRFWQSDRDAFDTLYTVLYLLCRTIAPLLPMVAESIYRDLSRERSVHLADWPDASALPDDPELVAGMDLAREACSAAHSVRRTLGLRVRLPLPSLTVASPAASRLEPFLDLLRDEVNVKDVRLTAELGGAGDEVLQLVPAVLGPRIGADVQKLIQAVRAGNWERTSDGSIVVADRILEPDEFTLRLTPRDPDVGRPLPGNEGIVALDVTVTPELEAEGLARDVVRLVNEARREAGLHVGDRIRLVLDVADDVRDAVATHRSWVGQETLATEVLFGELAEGHRGELPDGRALRIGIALAGA